MSGHSKWATIKRKKAAIDAKRGKVFTKLIREVTVAVRMGGADADSNPRLRQALLTARAQNVPSDNLDRAVRKASGEDDSVQYEEVMFEVYGPGGVAILIETMTDNRNRTVPEIRHLLSKRGLALADSGSAAHTFSRRGQLLFSMEGADEERLMEIALEAGAEDAAVQGKDYEVLCEPSELETVREAFEAAGHAPREYGSIFYPSLTIPLAGEDAERCLSLIEALEDHDDVQKVWANFDISEEEMERIGDG